MAKLKVEIQMLVLTIIIGIVVITIGFFSYKSLSKIVHSIQEGTHADNKVYIMKEIVFDLAAVENAVRLYSLTKNNDDLEVFYSLEEKISTSLKELNELIREENNDLPLVDSLAKLSQEKLDLWNEILKINLTSKSIFPSFSKLYTNIDEPKLDNLPKITGNNIFSENNADSRISRADTTFSDKSLERETVKKDIQRLEWEIYKNSKRKNVQESKLIEKNAVIVTKLNRIIYEAENREAARLLENAAEADRLAEATYKRLAVYTVSAVLMLFVALFVLFRYMKKSRAAQNALADAREKAEALARAKEQFAANVSHELRTPVNAIYGLSEQVLQKNLDKNTSEMVSVIFKSAGHLRNMVNDTLDFSKILSKNVILESVDFSPHDILDEVYSLLKNEAANKGIGLSYTWEGEKPYSLSGDPLRLKQIIINLTGNAIKFTEKGEVKILAKGIQTNPDNFELEIQITDTGIGIEKDKLKVVFDEYVQIENQNGKKYSGTGLGLAIVKKLVDLQNGKIKLESIPGVGTKATVKIGYRLGEKPTTSHSTNEISEIPELFRKIEVLIVDDEDFNRFLLKSILQKWKVKFKEARNGKEAVDAACKGNFNIILMDINMPEMGGIEASQAISGCNSKANIVAVTAVTDQLDKKACAKAGMKGFLFKPFSEKDLFNTINSMIEDDLNKSKKISGKDNIDMRALKHLSGNDDKFLAEMIRLFIQAMENGVKGIEEALKNENWTDIYENAHKMAAPVNHMGASNLYKKIKHLEKISKQATDFEAVVNLFLEIKSDIAELNSSLISALDEIKV